MDKFTKGILTVIAFSLVVIAFKDTNPISNAFAHGGNDIHKITLCDIDSLRCAKIINGGLQMKPIN